MKDKECDPIARLSCVNGQCSCPDGLQKYEYKSRKCVALVGSRCRINLNHEVTGEIFNSLLVDDVPSFCVQGAACDMKIPVLDGTCECMYGYEVAENRTCVPTSV